MTERKKRDKCWRCNCKPHCEKDCTNCENCEVCDCKDCLDLFHIDENK